MRLILLALPLLLCACTDSPTARMVGSAAPDFTVKDSDKTLSLHDFKGKVVVLNFWTTWCAYCTPMESMLSDVRTKFSGRDDIVFLTINADEVESDVAPFLQNQKPGGILLFADGAKQAFHVESIPTVLVLDQAGKIAYRTQGFAPEGFTDLATAAITKASATGP
jgi:peroxiredoxin